MSPKETKLKATAMKTTNRTPSMLNVECWMLNVSVILLFMTTAWSAPHYVDAASTNATPPYTNWATAARVIQDAVESAALGDDVVVTNGIYATGGRALYDAATNRVAVHKRLTLRSVNGPGFTVIDGCGTYRCVALASGAHLSGFTLTYGYACREWWEMEPASGSGGGVWCLAATCVVSNCVIAANSATEAGGAYGGTLYNCALSNNSTVGWWDDGMMFNSGGGGGAKSNSLINCLLTGNSASWGGGAEGCLLSNCVLSGNSVASGGRFVTSSGGGAYTSTLNNCLLTGNSAVDGGGADYCTLNDCTLFNNAAVGGWSDRRSPNLTSVGNGGGACYSRLNNCAVLSNSAGNGGGAAASVINNCTVTGNTATSGGGAAGVEGGNGWGWHFLHFCSLTNSIVNFNTATNGDNYWESKVNYCCTTPMLTNGVGNITNAPLFKDYAGGDLRLQSNSPCINAGNNACVPSATDLDGNPRIVNSTVDIGAYEYQGPGSAISYAWLQQFGLPTDGAVDATDPDADGLNVWQEWRCGTCPTNAASALRLLSASPTSTNVLVTWASMPGVSYFIERAADLSASFIPLATDIPGQPGTKTFADTNAVGPCFYRVGVGN
jgi:hypothetical protein